MARQGRRCREGRRYSGGDRNRQGDDGVRIDRRGTHRQTSRSGRCRSGEGQCTHCGACGGRRSGCRAAGPHPCCGATQTKSSGSPRGRRRAEGAGGGRTIAPYGQWLCRACRNSPRHGTCHHDGARRLARCHGRRDAPRRDRVPDGRGSRAISGRLQGEPGLAGRIRRAPRHRHADHRTGFHRPGHRRSLRRIETDCRVHDLQLRDAGDGSAGQFGGEDALYVGRPDGLFDRLPRSQRPGRARRRATQPGLRLLVRAYPGIESDLALFRRPMRRGC